MASIGKLLGLEGNDELKLVYDAAQELEKLEEDVGTTAYELPVELDYKQGAQVKVFNQPVDLTFAVQAAARIHAANYKTDVFGTGEQHQAGDGRSLAEATIGGQFGASAEASIPEAPLTINASGAAAAGIEYRHLVPVLAGQKRRSALAAAVSRSRLPQLVDLTQLRGGEVHRLDAHLKLDFGLKVKKGSEFDINEVVQVFGGLGVPIKAHVRHSVEGSLGWSFYEAMSLTLGKANQLNEGWVRLRLERQSKNTLTLGASLAAQVEYDIATGLEGIFDRMLGLVPTPGVLESFRELDQLVDEGGWDAVKAKLSGEAGDWVSEWVDDLGWKELLASSPEVQKLIGLSQRVVAAYDGIEPRIQGWWQEFLASADLAPDSKVIGALTKISQIDPEEFSVEQLVDDEWKEAIDLLEILTGKSLEDFLLSADQQARAVLERAQKLAAQALAFVNDVPAEAISRIRELAERSGIASTVEFLRQNTSSKEALEAAIDAQIQPRIKKLVERLLDKAWSEIKESDLARVASWADKVSDLLDKKAEWEEKIRKELRRLKGEVGFSFGFELERASHTSALLDVEVSPTADKLLRGISDALPSGSAQKLLLELPESEDTPEGDVEELPYRIREAVFTSSRIRTTTVWVSLFGMRSTKNRRVRESEIRLRQDGRGIAREASYSGAYFRTETEKQKSETSLSTAGIAILTEASGRGANLASPYRTMQQSLRISFSRDDDKTLVDELDAMDTMLAQLGFAGGPGGALRDELTAHQPQTRFAVQISFDKAAIDELTREASGQAGLAAWSLDYLNGAHRWYDDGLVGRTATGLKKVPVGRVNAKLITLRSGQSDPREAQFRDIWLKGLGGGGIDDWARNYRERIPVDGKQVLVDLFGQSFWKEYYISLRSLAARRRPSARAAGRIHRAWEQSDSRAPVDLERLSKIAASRFQRISAYDWDSPLFNFWFTIARLSGSVGGKTRLKRAKGVATLRWREHEGQSWSEPWTWQLPDGVRTDLRETGVFPIR